MKPTNTYEFTMAPNGSYKLLVAGDYFKILEASGNVDVEADWGRLTNLTAGQGLEQSPFQYLFFKDRSGGANAMRVVIGDEKFIDGQSGAVSVSNNVVARSAVMANANVTVTNASAVHSAANSSRQYLLIQNKHASGNLFVSFGAAATTANGVRVGPGGAYESGAVCPTGAVHIIGDIASNADVVIVEG